MMMRRQTLKLRFMTMMMQNVFLIFNGDSYNDNNLKQKSSKPITIIVANQLPQFIHRNDFISINKILALITVKLECMGKDTIYNIVTKDNLFIRGLQDF